jgi:hypothetical protein
VASNRPPHLTLVEGTRVTGHEDAARPLPETLAPVICEPLTSVEVPHPLAPATPLSGSCAEAVSAIDGWSRLVVQVVMAEADVPTMSDWARLARMKDRTLRARCEVAGARPKDSLDIGRLLRAVRVGDPEDWRPEAALVYLDGRALRHLLVRGGVVTWHHRRRPGMGTVLSENAFAIPRACLEALERQLGA